MSIGERLRTRRTAAIPKRDEPASRESLPVVLDDLVPFALSSPEASLRFSLPRCFKLVGVLDVGLLSEAFAVVLRQHSALRTRLHVADGVVTAEIDRPPTTFDLNYRDMSTSPREERDEVVHDLVGLQARIPFDPPLEWPLRVHILRVDVDAHVVLMNANHLMTDGHSLRLILRDLRRAYLRQELSRDDPLQLYQFSDWQRYWLRSEEASKSRAYWVNTLRHSAEAASFSSSEVTVRKEGNSEIASLSDHSHSSLLALSQTIHVTFGSIILAAYFVALSLESGREDVAIGVPMANRVRPGADSCVGFLVNTQAIRVRVRRRDSLRQTITNVAQVLLLGQQHQEYPLAHLLQNLSQKESNDFPELLFDNIFVMHRFAPNEPLSAHLSMEQMASPDTGVSMSGTMLQALRTRGGVRLQLQWDGTKFHRGDGMRVMRNILTTCEQFGRSPDQTLDELSQKYIPVNA